MRRTPVAGMALLAWATSLGCSEDGELGTSGGSSSTGGAGGSSDGGSGAAGDEGTSCDDAVALVQQSNGSGVVHYPHPGVIEQPGDRDYFRFEAEAGQWMGIVVQANPEHDPSKVDTVLTLYADSGATLMAQRATGFSSSGFDAEIIHRFDSAGSYCLEVMEHSEFEGEQAEGDPSFVYDLLVYPVDFERFEDWNLDQEPNEDAANAQGLSTVAFTNEQFTRIAGGLGDSDVDVYRLEAGENAAWISAQLAPSGAEGFGSTAGPGLVRLRRDEPGGSMLAEIDYQLGAVFVGSPIEPETSVLLEVERATGLTVDPRDFYVARVDALPSGLTETEPNDTSGVACECRRGDSFDPNRRYADHWGELPAGDVDWWQFFADEGASLEVLCASRFAGSSLRDATFAIFEPCLTPGCEDDQPLRSITETATTEVYWQGVAPSDGKYYMRVTASGYEPAVESTVYMCLVIVTNPG